MAKSIKSIGNDILLKFFNSNKEDYYSFQQDNIVRTGKLVSGDPDLVTPISSEGKKCYIWSALSGLERVTLRNDKNIGDSIFGTSDISFTKNYKRNHFQLSHLVLVDMTDTTIEASVYSLSDNLILSIIKGDVKQTVYHKTGRVVTTE